MKKRLLKAAAAFIILAVFLWSPFSNYPVSLAVMKIYSGIHERDSIMTEKGIELRIPGGGVTREKDWYPFVMTFNDDAGFRRFTGEADVKLTILYNFPAFDLSKGCSRLYDPCLLYTSESTSARSMPLALAFSANMADAPVSNKIFSPWLSIKIASPHSARQSARSVLLSISMVNFIFSLLVF